MKINPRPAVYNNYSLREIIASEKHIEEIISLFQFAFGIVNADFVFILAKYGKIFWNLEI